MYIYNFIYMEVFITFRHLQIPPQSENLSPPHPDPWFVFPKQSWSWNPLLSLLPSPGCITKRTHIGIFQALDSVPRTSEKIDPWRFSSQISLHLPGASEIFGLDPDSRTLVWRESCFSPLLHLSVFIPPFCFLPLFFLLPFLLVFKHLFPFLPFPFQSFLCIVLSSYPSLWFSNSFSVSLWDQRIS